MRTRAADVRYFTAYLTRLWSQLLGGQVIVTPPSRRCALRGDRLRDSGGGEAEGKKRAHQRTRRGACLGLGLERCERGDLGFESGELG